MGDEKVVRVHKSLGGGGPALFKQCRGICRLVKPAADFSVSSKNKDGLQSWCKECTNKYRNAKAADVRAMVAPAHEEHQIARATDIRVLYAGDQLDAIGTIAFGPRRVVIKLDTPDGFHVEFAVNKQGVGYA